MLEPSLHRLNLCQHCSQLYNIVPNFSLKCIPNFNVTVKELCFSKWKTELYIYNTPWQTRKIVNIKICSARFRRVEESKSIILKTKYNMENKYRPSEVTAEFLMLPKILFYYVYCMVQVLCQFLICFWR